MAQEDDLLACLLDVAEAELNSLNRQENCSVQLPKNDEYITRNKNGKLQDIDLFSFDNNQEKLNPQGTNKERSLIHNGDTDSSDDESNRNYENKKYNESGRSIKSMLSHSNSMPDRGNVKHSKSTLSSNWKSKITSEQKQTTLKKSTASLKETSNIVSSDTMFGIRVVNPVISSKTLEEKMVGRKVVPILHINNYLKSLNKNDDWVIAGVLCNKGTTKTSAKGHQFMIWTISDLLGDIKTVALFLFGSAYEQFWKTQSGSVVGVLNPSILEKRDGSRDEATLSVDNSQKLIILGQSKDLGMCKSTKKNGDKCTAIVNKRECEYCVYHIKKEYQNCSRRSELQANFSGKGLIALRNKVLGKNEVFYAGKSYTAIPAKQSRKMIKKDKDRLQTLNGMATTSSTKKAVVKKAAATFDVDRGQRVKDIEILRKLGASTEKYETQSNSNFQSNQHSAEVSMDAAKANAQKILSRLHQSEDKNPLRNKTEKENKSSHLLTGVKNGTDSTKMREDNSSKIELLQKSLDEIIQTDFIDLDIDYKSRTSTTSFLNNRVENERKLPSDLYKNGLEIDGIEKLPDPYTGNSPLSTSNLISSNKKRNSVREQIEVDKNTPPIVEKKFSASTPSQSNSGPVFSKTLLANVAPSLSNFEGVVDLSRPLPKKTNKAKLNALKYIEKHGPIEKSNPNKTRGKGIKRNLDEFDIDGNSKKLQKIQDNEFMSDRFKKMMELQSKHMDLVELRDNEEKEKYFRKQEVKEQMEEKMANTYKVECKAVRCLDCKYTNFSAAEKCKIEKHRLVYKNATKRFFKCGNCGNRVACLDIIPLYSCKNCGDGRWERTTMMKEKNVTNMVNLSIRGGEQKFANSVVTDANINLMVPDDS